jgi:hypothetical protein
MSPASELHKLETKHVGERIGEHVRLEFEHGSTERSLEPGQGGRVDHRLQDIRCVTVRNELQILAKNV